MKFSLWRKTDVQQGMPVSFPCSYEVALYYIKPCVHMHFVLLSADHVQEAVHHRLEVLLVFLHSLDVGLDLLQMNLSGVPEEVHQGQHVPERI